MAEQYLLLDAATIFDLFGRESDGGFFDLEVGSRALSNQIASYDLIITDTVLAELTRPDGTEPFTPGLQDRINQFINDGAITKVTTDIPRGTEPNSQAGDLSIKTVMEDPTTFGLDDQPRFIATSDQGYFVDGGDGAAFADSVIRTEPLVKSATVSGDMNVLDYKAITENSPQSDWSGANDFRSVAAEALTEKGIPTTWNEVTGNFDMDVNGSTLSVSEGGIFKSAAAVSIGEYLGATGAEAQALTDAINAKLSGPVTAKVLAGVGLAAAAVDSLFSAVRAKELFDNGDAEGGTEELGALAGRLTLGITAGEIGAIGGFAVGGPIGAIIGGTVFGGIGAVAGSEIGETVTSIVYDAVQAITDFTSEIDFNEFLDTLSGIGSGVSNFFYNTAVGINSILQGVDDGLISEFAQQFTRINNAWDPLIVDLDGNGFANTVGTQVYFDLDSDGLFAELTNAWSTPDDGFIVWDRNGNSQADDGVELFGAGVSENSWENLAVYDLNVDSVIDANDAIWNDLYIWQDKNSDGITQSDEWFTMADIGITSINFPTGTNPFLGTVTTDNGELRTRGVQFNPDESNTRFLGDVEIDFTTLFLPELRGFNHLNDLRIAMSLDNEGTGNLLELATNLATGELGDKFADMLQYSADFTQMMYQWADVQDIDPSSRGVFLSDARQLEFLEVYFGRGFFQARWPEENPLSLAADAIENTFAMLRDDLMAKFMFQSGGAALFENPGEYDLATDSVGGPFALNEQVLLDLGTAGADAPDAEIFWANVLLYISEMRDGLDNLSVEEIAILDAAIALSDPALNFANIDLQVVTGESLDISGTENDDFLAGGNGDDLLQAKAISLITANISR